MKNKMCINCGKPATCEHHIVPISLGGFDIPSNKVALCDECHGKIHGIQFGNGSISHSELIKQGIQRKREAIAKGEKYQPRSHRNSDSTLIGRPRITAKDLPKIFIALYTTKTYNSISDLAKRCNCSRTTVYKYIELFEGREHKTMRELIAEL